MCGISGIIALDGSPVADGIINRMMQLQKHRGPDDEGIFSEAGISLGFVRLSILDLSQGGHQPMFSHDREKVIVFNGEIFNYIELREELSKSGHVFSSGSDTEVLMAAYEEWGEACLDRLNGMWSFAIYDRSKGSLFASRDRYGIKPFYYYESDGFLAFSSEIPPLLPLIGGKAKVNTKAVFEYLVYNRTDQDESTFFEGIKKLQHGHNLLISHDHDSKNCSVQIRKWYDLREKVHASNGFASSEEFRDLFIDSVKLRLRSDVPVGVCLSGGLDSSSIASVLIDLGQNVKIDSFSAVYGSGVYGDESGFINEINSGKLSKHFIKPDSESLLADLETFIKIHGEPLPSTGPYAQFKVMELAHGNVVVTLDGQGADEMLAGYHYFFGFYFKSLLKRFRIGKFVREIYKYFATHSSLYGLKTFVFFLLPEKLRTESRIMQRGYLSRAFAVSNKYESKIAGDLYGSRSLKESLINHFEFKLEHLLKWEDRNSMWFSIEARVPFLDHRLVEKTLSSDEGFIIRDGSTKAILRDSMKGIVPEKIRKRKDKMGFGTPQAEWFREPALKSLVENIINSESFAKREIISPDKAAMLFKRHLDRKTDISREIWKWINLELWFRYYIDRDNE